MSRPISASYLERKLRAIAGVQGANPLPDLADLNGLIVLENDRPEWMKPAGEELIGGVVNEPLVALNTSATQLNNPAGSGILVIVERIILSQSAAGGVSLKIGFGTANLATQFNVKSARDTRGRNAGTQTNSAALMFGQNTTVGDPSGGQVFAQALVPTNTPTYWDQPIILSPDTSLYVVCGVVNQTLISSFFWRERPLEGSFEIR